eukprot:728076_1
MVDNPSTSTSHSNINPTTNPTNIDNTLHFNTSIYTNHPPNNDNLFIPTNPLFIPPNNDNNVSLSDITSMHSDDPSMDDDPTVDDDPMVEDDHSMRSPVHTDTDNDSSQSTSNDDTNTGSSETSITFISTDSDSNPITLNTEHGLTIASLNINGISNNKLTIIRYYLHKYHIDILALQELDIHYANQSPKHDSIPNYTPLYKPNDYGKIMFLVKNNIKATIVNYTHAYKEQPKSRAYHIGISINDDIYISNIYRAQNGDNKINMKNYTNWMDTFIIGKYNKYIVMGDINSHAPEWMDYTPITSHYPKKNGKIFVNWIKKHG